jgi:hypothetical protein
MNTDSIFTKISKRDFFILLPPGFYIFMVANICFIATTEPQTLNELFWRLSDHVKKEPALLIFVLFACYLIGNIIRAIPVHLAERSIPPFANRFPFCKHLKEVAKSLTDLAEASNLTPEKMPDISNGISREVYLYWMKVLCINSADGFEYIQTFETRVRLFAGMIWASWIGLICGTYTLLIALHTYPYAGIGVLLASMSMLLTFGVNFRRVRKQESEALFLTYTALLQKLCSD